MTSLATVTLPDNLYWSDEYQWSLVDQSAERTLSGALTVEETAKQSGRPITLEGMWVSRSVVEDLRLLEAQEASAMTLTLPDARTFQTLFRRGSDLPVDAKPLFSLADPDDTDTYRLTLRLMEQ